MQAKKWSSYSAHMLKNLSDFWVGLLDKAT